MIGFAKAEDAVELKTLNIATDTTLIYGFDAQKNSFSLKDTKPGQVDDRLRMGNLNSPHVQHQAPPNKKQLRIVP